MNLITSYKDLCREIAIWEDRIEAYGTQIKALEKLGKLNGPQKISGIDYSQPSVTGTSQISFESAIVKIREITHKMEELRAVVVRLKDIQEKIKNKVLQLEGLEYKVVYMRDIEGKSLKEIADELNYSYDYMREVYSKVSHRNPTKQNSNSDKMIVGRSIGSNINK